MFQKVIYKRQYNKPTIEEIEAEIADEPIPAEVKEPAPLFGSGENNDKQKNFISLIDIWGNGIAWLLSRFYLENEV